MVDCQTTSVDGDGITQLEFRRKGDFQFKSGSPGNTPDTVDGAYCFYKSRKHN